MITTLIAATVSLSVAGMLLVWWLDRRANRRWFRCPKCTWFWTTTGDRELNAEFFDIERTLEIRCEKCRGMEDK